MDFLTVTAQLWVTNHAFPEQFVGSLPAAPTLVELYRNWQLVYQALCVRKYLRSQLLLEEDDNELEIDSVGITNVSDLGFDSLSQKLQEDMNQWLRSLEFLKISQQLRSQLDPREEIRVILETNDDLLRRLPWYRSDFYRDYPLAEMALSSPAYKRSAPLRSPTVSRKKVRILAILGHSKGIDLSTETKFLHSIQESEVVFLVNPSRQEFNTQLWDYDGWDILFFAGHSQTEGETGRIYINENQTNNSLTIEQLEEALKAAIDKGLRLAIFNSCDGLGLANALEKLNIPAVIVMREPVPNLVAAEFFQHFLLAFAHQRLPLYLAVQQARRKLQGLEDDFPGASWLPVICINPAVEPPTWLKLGGIPLCPYRGLFAFQEEDAHLFFGREEFTRDLVAAVKRKPLVAVVGSSGSGKSSVVFAGLIPQLRQDTLVQWQMISFRPGNNPIEALASAFAPLLHQGENDLGDNLKSALLNNGMTEADAEKQRRTRQAIIVDANSKIIPQLCNAPKSNACRLVELELAIALQQDELALYKIIEQLVQQNPGTRLVLIADQFEELYTQCLESARQPFLNGLLNAVKLAPAFTLVTTLRADFYGYALCDRSFSDVLQGAVLNLGPMSHDELRSCIEKPAAQMQVGLENALTNQLLHAVEGQPGRLPLLEFALTQLWSKQRDGLLTHQAYEEIGGVEEALANHAEQVYAQLSEADRGRAQQVFIQLVRLGEGAEATRRLATRDEVKSENWDLVTLLASSRLVVTNRNESTHEEDEETVEIVHEALMRSWGRLESWMQIDGEFRRWQEQLRSAIRQWERSGKDEGALLRGKPLADAEYWQDQRSIALSSGEKSFIKLSLELREHEINKQKRRRQLTILSLAGGLVGALMLAGVALWQWQKANIREIQALSTSSEALFASNDKLDALIEALKAWQKLQMIGVAPTETKTQVESVLRHTIYGAVEYNRLSEHSDSVNAVVFSPDGQMIASASGDKTVKLWKRDGTLLTTLNGHSEAVYGVVFSPDGQMIASASGDKTVKLWKLDGTEVTTFKNHSDKVTSVAFSPDGHTIATASWDKTVKLWKLDGTLLTTLYGHSNKVTAVTFSPDGKMIASADLDGKIKLWQRHGVLLTTLNDPSGGVYGVAFSPDSHTIAAASWDKKVTLWKRDGTLLTTLDGHNATVWAVAFSPDGHTIASASQDQTVKLWKWDNTLLTTLYGHSAAVNAVAFSPDGHTIATASDDKTVKLWKPDSILLKTLYGHRDTLWGVAFSPDGQTITSVSRDKTIKLWKQDGTEFATLNGHTDKVNAVVFSPDGYTIATASDDQTVKLWQRDGTLLTTLKGHTDEVWVLAFSPDGQIIATGSKDKTVKLWQRDGTLLTTLKGHRAGVKGIAFSPDGQIIATGSKDKTVKLWQRNGTLLTTLYGHSAAVWGVAFSLDGQIIATASDDKTIKLWKRDYTELATLKGHSATVWGVAFSPDGKTIASASEDKTVILWDLARIMDMDKLLSYGCGLVNDYLRTNAQVLSRDRHLCAGIKTQ